MTNTVNRFYFIGDRILEDKLQGGVKVSQQINVGQQLAYGVASAKEIKFSAVNLSYPAEWYIDKSATWKVFDGVNETSKGTVYVKNILKKNNTVEFTCYDAMCLFDTSIDGWLEAPFPMSLSALLDSLCVYYDIGIKDIDSLTNSGAIVYDNINATNLQAAQCFNG